MKEKSLQHYQVPNHMEQNDLEPKDQLIYLSIKFFDGKGGCFPSLQKISEKSGASINTIRASIKRLEEKEYIIVKKKGRGQEYIFNKYKNFECFSPEFLDNKDITFTTKSYLVASQQYMYTDIKGKGKISFSNIMLSDKINMPESTIRKCNIELKNKNLLTIVPNENRDLETGCKTETKIFHLDELGQMIIWTLAEHESRITKTENKVEQIEKEMKELKEDNKQKDKLINILLKELGKDPTKYTL